MEVGQKVKINPTAWERWYFREYGRKALHVPDVTTIYTVQRTHVDHQMQHRANIIDKGGTNLTFWTPVTYLIPVNSE